MDLTPAEIEQIETLIGQLETLDPAELPAPAAQLVETLNRILDFEEST